jgi:hypothetical protein
MRRLLLLILAGVLNVAVTAHAQLLFKEVRTASDTVLVALFESRDVTGPVWDRRIRTNEVNIADPALWKLDGRPATAIHQFVTPAEYCEYHVYLKGWKLVNGKRYTLDTPQGSTNFVFDDRKILCESIKIKLWLFPFIRCGRGFFRAPGLCGFPIVVLPAVRVPNRKTLCRNGPQARALSHHCL